MDILIAPWGNPTNWSSIKYKFGNLEKISSSSLNILQEHIKPDYTIILASDTLASNGSNYIEIKENAKKLILNHIEKFNINPENTKVFILSGIGKFNNIIFIGKAEDYYYSLIYQLVNFLLKNLRKNINQVNFHLDITHGINYMPVLVYRAIKELTEILAFFYKVNLNVYNADPAILTENVKELNVNVIEQTKIIPNPLKYKATGKSIINKLENNKNFIEDLKKLNKKLTNDIKHKDISAFIGAIYNGLPLALYTFFPIINKLKEYIDTAFKLYEKYIYIEDKEKLLINKIAYFTFDFRIYLFTYFFANLFLKKELIKNRKYEVSLTEIINVKDKFFNFNEKIKISLDREIHDLKSTVKNSKLELNKFYKLNELKGIQDNEPSNRNFLAHSGFEYKSILIKVLDGENKDIVIKYRDEYISGLIKNLCVKGLQ
ncbi:MAG: TIGR01897 family CRISPR-associated protein [Persephonella sp.]|nr:MAG: TIGR01897 family CRISPR-associated protein [Persephonella sp.]